MFKLSRRSIIIFLAIVCVAGIAYAKPTYWSQFNALYGTSGGSDYQSVLGSCLTCHTSGSTRNVYGIDFRNANHDFAAIEGLDSDGDGFTNIEEINAGTFPGDSASHPETTPPPPPPDPTPDPTPTPSPTPTPTPTPTPAPDPGPAPTTNPPLDPSALFSAPAPQITANGQTGLVSVSPNETITIAITMDAGFMAGRMCDWWVVLSSPFGLFSYVFPSGWQSGLAVTAQAPLFDLNVPFPVLNFSLPEGDYTFFLAVDNNADGVPDGTYLDYVTVSVH
jgi:hypothetical protein